MLELGRGTGSTALRLAPGTRHYLATDVSTEMIAIAREKLAAEPLAQLRFEVGDAEGPEACAASHDKLLAFNLLHLVCDLDCALRSKLATLKPDGFLISKTLCLSEMNPIVPRLLVLLMRAVGKAPAVFSFSATQLCAALERQGLLMEAVERHCTQRRDIRVFVVARKPG